MKPLFKQLVATMALGVTLPLGLPVVADAATPSNVGTGASSMATAQALASSDGSATVTIQGSGITLTSVPSFEGTGNLKNLESSGSIALNTESGKDKLSVNDARGTNTGWHVTAKLDTFENTLSKHSISGAKLQIPATKADDKSNLSSNLVTLTDDDSPKIILAHSATSGTNNVTVSFTNAKTQVTLPTDGIYADTYSGKITYTLDNGPQN